MLEEWASELHSTDLTPRPATIETVERHEAKGAGKARRPFTRGTEYCKNTSMSHRILITGSSGLLSSALVSAFSSKAVRIVRFDLRDQGEAHGDVRDRHRLRQAVFDVDDIIHPRRDQAQALLGWRARASLEEGLTRLIQAFRDAFRPDEAREVIS